MLFTDQIVPPDIAGGIRDLCFELFNALHKLESDIYQRQRTAWLLYSWADHELTHWYLDAECIAEKLDICKAENDIQGLAQELRDLAVEVKRCRQLFALYQAQDEDNLKGIKEFKNEIEAVLRKRAKSIGRINCPYELCIGLEEGDDCIPTVLLPVTIELIRNAFRHTSGGTIKVSCEKENGDIVLSVCSPIKKKTDYNRVRSILTENYIPGSSTKPRGLWLIKTLLYPYKPEIASPKSADEIDEKSVLTIKIKIPINWR
jgi:hypothetical protein